MIMYMTKESKFAHSFLKNTTVAYSRKGACYALPVPTLGKMQAATLNSMLSGKDLGPML
jgi:hypothetical protein